MEPEDKGVDVDHARTRGYTVHVVGIAFPVLPLDRPPLYLELLSRTSFLPQHNTGTHTRSFLVKQSSLKLNNEELLPCRLALTRTVPGRFLLCCHAMTGDIFRRIVGEDEEEHDDELPDEEPAFLPVERPHHAPACMHGSSSTGSTCSCLDEVVQPAKRRRSSATAGPGGA
nr:uncharacterized protein LOC109732497 [Aegilops tauschii subsp. strangulata]